MTEVELDRMRDRYAAVQSELDQLREEHHHLRDAYHAAETKAASLLEDRQAAWQDVQRLEAKLEEIRVLLDT